MGFLATFFYKIVLKFKSGETFINNVYFKVRRFSCDAMSLWMLAFSSDSNVARYIVFVLIPTKKKPVTMNAYLDNQNICVAGNGGGEEPPKSMGTSSSLYNFGVSGDTVVEHRTSEREVWVSKSNSAVFPVQEHFTPRKYW